MNDAFNFHEVAEHERVINNIIDSDTPEFDIDSAKIRLMSPIEKDLDEIACLEQAAWPEEIQATVSQIRRRFEIFSEGLLICKIIQGKINDLGIGAVIGMVASQRLDVIPEIVDGMTWDDSTDFGNMTKHSYTGNVLDLVSLGIHPHAQSKGIASKILLTMINRVSKMIPAIEHVTANVRIPGYTDYATIKRGRSQEPSVVDYVRTHFDSDPVLKLHRRCGGKFTFQTFGGQSGDSESCGHGVRCNHNDMLQIFKRRNRELTK